MKNLRAHAAPWETYSMINFLAFLVLSLNANASCGTAAVATCGEFAIVKQECGSQNLSLRYANSKEDIALTPDLSAHQYVASAPDANQIVVLHDQPSDWRWMNVVNGVVSKVSACQPLRLTLTEILGSYGRGPQTATCVLPGVRCESEYDMCCSNGELCMDTWPKCP